MHIVIVAGELSGDLLGGRLVRALMNIDKISVSAALAGSTCARAGAATLFDVKQTSVVGIVEVLRHYPRLRKILAA